MFKDRSTVDVVVVIFSLIIGLVLFLACTGSIIGKLLHPNMDISRGTELIASTVTTITGALIGFIGGRAQGRFEQANGGNNNAKTR